MSSSRQRLDELSAAVVANFLEDTGRNPVLEHFLSTLPNGRSSSFAASRRQADVPTLESLVLSHLTNQALPSSLSISSDGLPSFTPTPLYGPVPTQVTKTLKGVHASNVLSVKPMRFPRRRFDTTTAEWVSEVEECVATTSVDKTVKFTSTKTWDVIEVVELIPASPILSVVQHPADPRLLIAGTMSGDLIGWDLVDRRNVFHTKDHTKYVVRIAINPRGDYLATASYDRTIRIYSLVLSQPLDPSDPFAPPFMVALEPLKTLRLPSNPEALVWTPLDRPEGEWLLFSRREDCFVRGVKVPLERGGEWEEAKWNTNANGDLWVSFDIVDIAIPQPQTHLSLLMTSPLNNTTPPRILLLPLFQNASPSSLSCPIIYTSASTSPLVTPRHAWSSTGTFCAITSDDGCLSVQSFSPSSQSWNDTRIGAHGPGAPLEKEEIEEMQVDEPEGEGQWRKREAVRRVIERRRADKGSGVIRDVCMVANGEGKADTMVSVGFDWSVRVMEPL